jgi:hypothetical protein
MPAAEAEPMGKYRCRTNGKIPMQKQEENTDAETKGKYRCRNKGKALDIDRRNRYYNINRQPVG